VDAEGGGKRRQDCRHRPVARQLLVAAWRLDHKPIEMDLRKDLKLLWKGVIVILAGERKSNCNIPYAI
jgi:hypothetical protein